MLGRLLFLLMIMPFLELFVIVKVHSAVSQQWGSQSAWTMTLGMIFLAAIVGVSLIRNLGFRLLSQLQDQMRKGSTPSQTMLDGFLMLASGIAFIVPGYITDVIGILLLLPWIRSLLQRAFKSWLGKQVQKGTVVVHQSDFYRSSGPLIQDTQGGEIIDVEPLQK
jgi:UPF0716 protein FxsA